MRALLLSSAAFALLAACGSDAPEAPEDEAPAGEALPQDADPADEADAMDEANADGAAAEDTAEGWRCIESGGPWRVPSQGGTRRSSGELSCGACGIAAESSTAEYAAAP